MSPDLRQHLWDCAEILRGSAVDRTDWKASILRLLYFKRISEIGAAYDYLIGRFADVTKDQDLFDRAYGYVREYY
jgi:hypothetical protein